MTDLTTLSNEDLDTLRVNVLTEVERRARILSAPETIGALTVQLIHDGGDAALALQAVTEAQEKATAGAS